MRPEIYQGRRTEKEIVPRPFSQYLKEFEDGNTELRCISRLVRGFSGPANVLRQELLNGLPPKSRPVSVRFSVKPQVNYSEIPLRVVGHETFNDVVVFEVVNVIGKPISTEEHQYIIVGKDPRELDAHLLTVWQEGLPPVPSSPATVDVSPEIL